MAFPLQLTDYTLLNKTFRLLEPEKEAVSISYKKGEIAFPYWSQVWPAAVGMGQFILQHQEYISGKRVLELAAGLGLPSLIAATNGAAFVTTSDYMPEAVAVMQQTIAYHQLQNIEATLLDWTALPNHLMADTLLLCDVSYDEQLFAVQEKVIRRFVESGTTVIISTPQRLIAKQAIQPLLPLCKHQEEIFITHQQQPVAVSLFVL